MIYIRKGKEPVSLTKYRQMKDAYYDGYKNREELREALLRDQGHICAYCMRRIYNDHSKMKIEHLVPQSQLCSEKEALDYKIMLGVCDGCKGDSDKNTTCDEHRHDAELYVNPLNEQMMETIVYSRNGKIMSLDSRVDYDLNHVLNLNCEQAKSRIVLNRKKIYEECKHRLMRIQKTGNWKKETIQKVLDYYQTEVDGKKTEFLGVPLYILKKEMRRAE